MCSDPYKVLRSLRIYRIAYEQNCDPEDFASLAIIEGLDLNVSPFH
jgi:hypothetical protein